MAKIYSFYNGNNVSSFSIIAPTGAILMLKGDGNENLYIGIKVMTSLYTGNKMITFFNTGFNGNDVSVSGDQIIISASGWYSGIVIYL